MATTAALHSMAITPADPTVQKRFRGSETAKRVSWNPKSPSSLVVPSISSSDGAFTFGTFLSDDGVGCNDDETSALIRLLDARDEVMSPLSPSSMEHGLLYGRDRGMGRKLRELSRKYRRALQACLVGWEDRLLQRSESGTGRGKEEEEEEGNSLELLKLMFAIAHLSEVYLLPPLDDVANADRRDAARLWQQQPGSVTADTVRYLRLHHMENPYDDLDADVAEMLNSSQPEFYGGDGRAYWTLLRRLVGRGCLAEAWAVLSHHSACRECASVTASEGGGGASYGVREEDAEAFAALRAILLSAPLPGGRDDVDDAGLAAEDEEEEAPREEEETLMEDVPPKSYQLWDSIPNPHEDYPLRFDANAAAGVYNLWVRTAISAIQSPPLSNLLRRVPQLRSMLDVLTGKNFDVGDTWAEALCAELLYGRPVIRMEDVYVRARRAMERFGALKGDEGKRSGRGFEEIVLSVMRGGAGRVVEALHDFGGGSGAALPATVTALLCDILTEANLIPTVEKDGLPFDLRTELLLSASHSIVSSLSSTHGDVGVRLATRLLLPFAKPTSDARIVATLSEILQRHAPDSDAEVRGLLDLAEPLVKRGSVRALDGCTSLVMSRYWRYRTEGRPGGCAYWLLRGMEVESRLPEGYSGSGTCRRRLGVDCEVAAGDLAKVLVQGEDPDDVGIALGVATEIERSVKEDGTMSGAASKMREVRLLSNAIKIALGLARGDDALAGGGMTSCLAEYMDESEGGAVLTLAPWSLYEGLLALAFGILSRDEEENEVGAEGTYKAAFDVRGIHALMARFEEVSDVVGPRGGNALPASNAAQTPEEAEAYYTEEEMRLTLCRGLARAFVSENAERKVGAIAAVNGMTGTGGTRTEAQRLELLLGPSM